jgi:hypothetical protein
MLRSVLRFILVDGSAHLTDRYVDIIHLTRLATLDEVVRSLETPSFQWLLLDDRLQLRLTELDTVVILLKINHSLILGADLCMIRFISFLTRLCNQHATSRRPRLSATG